VTKSRPDTRERARLAILNYVTNFCLTKVFGEGDQGDDRRRAYPATHGFRPTTFSDDEAQAGDLVALSSAPTSKWHLSWVRAVEDLGPHGSRYLLESIHDGSLCWWSNVSVAYLEREQVAAHPSWLWTDRQHAFADRWTRACRVKRNAYITLPVPPVFTDGFEVTLGTRTRFGFDDYRPTRTFPDWRKVKVADMLAFYDEAVAAKPKKGAA
jgi:hypothetical protein